MKSLDSATTCIHWLNLTAVWGEDEPGSSPLYQFIAWANSHWGEAEPCSGARDFYRRGWRWPTGARVLFEPCDKSLRCSVSLPGVVLDEFDEFGARVVFAELYAMGFTRCSRIDVAADLRGPGVCAVIDRFAAAAELRSIRSIRYSAPKAEPGGTAARPADTWKLHRGEANHGVSLGSRQSCRYVRFYDKGLESGLAPRGEWLRWEVEYGNASRCAMAQAVWSRVLQAACGVESCSGVEPRRGEFWPAELPLSELLRRLVASSVEVGTPCGRTSRQRFFRRPAWFVSLLGQVQAVKLNATVPVYRCLERTAAWVQRCVMPVLRACAIASGQSIERVLSTVGGSDVRRRRALPAAAVQYALRYRGRLASSE